jgi:putative serine protease PepD
MTEAHGPDGPTWSDDPGWLDRWADDPWRPPQPERPVQPTEIRPEPVPFLDTVGRPEQPPRGGPRPATLVAGGLVIALLAGGIGGVVGARLSSRDTGAAPSGTDSGASLGAVPTGDLSRPPESVAGIAQRVLPTVVSIDVESATSGGTGSGFVIRQDGYLLTNNHVVASGGPGTAITVSFSDGRTAKATVVGTSPSYDLAVLKVARTGLPVATLGDSDTVVVGDQTIAIGSPLGLAGTVTSGILSAKDRPVTTGLDDGSEPSFISALQTDAAINPGNSGGPLVDGQARVIGVNSAIATLSGGSGQTGSIGLGFSIPINQARRVAEQLIRQGYATYPVIGAALDPAYQGPGVRLASVTAGGPAGSAGLRAGDVITAIQGQPVSRTDELIVDIRRNQPGDTVRLTYLRGGQQGTASVTLGSARG